MLLTSCPIKFSRIIQTSIDLRSSQCELVADFNRYAGAEMDFQHFFAMHLASAFILQGTQDFFNPRIDHFAG